MREDQKDGIIKRLAECLKPLADLDDHAHTYNPSSDDRYSVERGQIHEAQKALAELERLQLPGKLERVKKLIANWSGDGDDLIDNDELILEALKLLRNELAGK